VIASQAEIELVHRGRRRQMLLPLERHSTGAALPCPVGVGDLVSLQTKPGVKGTKVTVVDVGLSYLGAVTPAQAQQQGYAGVQGAREAFERQHGRAGGDERPVWVVQFVLGDHTGFFASHRERYLIAKMGRRSYTTDPDQAANGEPAVTESEQLELARAARERRNEDNRTVLREQRVIIRAALRRMRDVELDRLVESELARLERRLERIDELLDRRQAA
jgi:hypothetical protein